MRLVILTLLKRYPLTFICSLFSDQGQLEQEQHDIDSDVSLPSHFSVSVTYVWPHPVIETFLHLFTRTQTQTETQTESQTQTEPKLLISNDFQSWDTGSCVLNASDIEF